MRKYFILLGLAAVSAAACTSVEAPVSEQGLLTMNVSVSEPDQEDSGQGSVWQNSIVGNYPQHALPRTKAAMGQAELLSTAKVNIYMADFSGLVRSYNYADVPASIYLPVESYRVDVLAGECAKEHPAAASWEQKSYKGSKEFAIVAGQNTSVQVEAKVSNAVTEVTFDSSVTSLFPGGYSLRIGLDDDSSLVYDAATAGQNGYFIVDGLDEPALSWSFRGTLDGGMIYSKTGVISDVQPGMLYKLKLKYTLKDGSVSFDILVDYATDIIDDTIIFEPVSTGLAASSRFEVWAAHATVYADVDESEYNNPSAVKFAYSADGNVWTTVDSERTSEGSYKALLKGLTPSTAYSYRLVIGGEVIGDSMTFTTEAAPSVPNGSFENISKVDSYYVWFDPSSPDPSSRNMWWGSGNGTDDVSGSASMGIVITEPDGGDKIDGSRSVRLQSRSIVGMLAAGNLFSGKFMGLVGTSGGRVAFGRPWTARPTALRCWVKYSTGKINIIKSTPSGVTVTKNDYDRAMVRVALGTWNYKTYGGSKESPILVNTTEPSSIIDFTKDPSTIALGEAVFQGDAANSTNEWREVLIPIVYSNENVYPTHIVISCASSYYGDYFTGSDSSKLWIDKMELVYE